MEKCTVYVENFPQSYDLVNIARIFKNYKIRDVRISKGKNGTFGPDDARYAFVEMGGVDEVEKAVSELDGKEIADGCVLRVMSRSAYLAHKQNLIQLKTDLRNAKMMESTKDMMRDDDDPLESPYFVKLVLAKGQKELTTKMQIKDFISEKCANGISPNFIDFRQTQPANTVILRFNE